MASAADPIIPKIVNDGDVAASDQAKGMPAQKATMKNPQDPVEKLMTPGTGATGVHKPGMPFIAKMFSSNKAKETDIKPTESFVDDSYYEKGNNQEELKNQDGQEMRYKKPRARNEDSDDDMADCSDDDEAETEKREQMLRDGRAAAVDSSREEVEIPLDVAIVINQSAHIFRAAFAQGRTQDIMTTFRQANERIMGQNRTMDRTYTNNGRTCYDSYVMPESIFDLIEQLRNELATLKELRQNGCGESDEAWIKANMQLAHIALTAKQPLARIGLSWRNVTPDDVKRVVENAFRYAIPRWDPALREIAATWLHQEWKKPSRPQELALMKSVKPMTEFFENLETGETEKAQTQIEAIGDLNIEICNMNAEDGNGTKTEDATLPLHIMEPLLHAYIGTSMAERPQRAKAIRAAVGVALEALGYQALQAKLPAYDVQLLQGYEDDLRRDSVQSLVKWRGQDYSQIAEVHEANEPVAQQAPATLPQDSRINPESREGSASSMGKSLFVDQHSSSASLNDQPITSHVHSPGLRTQGFRGPVTDGRKTSYGHIMGSKDVGRGSRHILNVGTTNQPVYRSFPGATFGRGTGAKWARQYPLPPVNDLKNRKATEVDAICGIAVVETASTARAPITYFPVRWKGSQTMEWLTRSELTSICGKIFVKQAFDSLYDDWKANLSFLEDMKKKRLHPDTEQPLTAADIAEMPWLAPGGTAESITGAKTSKTADGGPTQSDTTGIKFATTKFGRTKV